MNAQPHVLYVDDDAANLVVFEAACARDFPVLTAGCADAALSALHEHEVAVLLTDQRMPGTTGVELAARVREEFPDTLTMLVTAYSDLDATIEAINRGTIRRYVRKPWDPRELRAALAEALDLYRLTRQMRGLERRLVETERVYALGVVAAGVAHELRNPVSWLKANLDMAILNVRKARDALRAVPTPGEDIARTLDKAYEELADADVGADRICDIVKGIELPVRQRLGEDLVDLATVVRLTLRMVRSEIRHRGTARVDVADVPPVRASPTRIGQVVLNLVVNAIQALPPGRRTPENQVWVRLRPEPGHAVLEVEDNGCGMAPETVARVFDPFFTSKADGGTGLGLAISKRIVEEIGGRVEVESAPGVGTTLRVVLPVEAG